VADVVLVGLPGSGKTTTGRALAQRLARPFHDTDDVFFEIEGVSVQDYLRTHDESEFRRHELAALEHALRGEGVVATGGGVVTTSEARELLARELTVWLDCDDGVLFTRVRGGDRPLLGEQPEVRLADLRARRDALYREVSHFRVDAARSTEQLVTDLAGIVATSQAPS
jgi:shikimate kinase